MHGQLNAELADSRANLQQVQLDLVDEQKAITTLEADVRAAKEDLRKAKEIAERRDREVRVKEREVEFLKSLIVSGLHTAKYLANH